MGRGKTEDIRGRSCQAFGYMIRLVEMRRKSLLLFLLAGYPHSLYLSSKT